MAHVSTAPAPTAVSEAAIIPLVARLLISVLFIIAGIGKVSDPAGTIGYISSVGLPFPTLGYAMALIVEIGGGLALIAGLGLRFVAPVLAIFSLMTALIFHSDLGDAGQAIHFYKNIAIAGGLLLLRVTGAGLWSIDSRRG